MFSKAPSNRILLLGYPFSKAVQASNQWEMERSLAGATTECFTTLIPEGENEDISVNLLVGRVEGLQILNTFMMERTWSASPSHQLLQSDTQQEHHEPHSL